jgi:2-alkyl-3-oxoalkanoate reductase
VPAAVQGRGDPGIYNIVDDDPAPVSEWLPVMAEHSDAKPPRQVPTWVGRLAVGEVGVSMMTKIRGSSNARAKRELGWRPAHPTWRTSLGCEALVEEGRRVLRASA